MFSFAQPGTIPGNIGKCMNERMRGFFSRPNVVWMSTNSTVDVAKRTGVYVVHWDGSDGHHFTLVFNHMDPASCLILPGSVDGHTMSPADTRFIIDRIENGG